MTSLKHLGVAAALAMVLGAGYAIAQSGHQQGHGAHGGAANPYSAFKDRQIKALSPEQEADLRQGRGMGLALAAEMNGYPGPMHVLQLADQIGLSADQRARLDALFARMKVEAVAVGEQAIALERDLDNQFVSRSITPESLVQLTSDIGLTQGKLRATHLRYHLDTVAILSTEQIARYNVARGYTR